MRERTLLPVVAAVSILVAIGTLLSWGWNAAGTHAAARYTARISSIWFALAVAAPGLRRYWDTLAPVRATLAFLTAHAIHFATVTAALVGFDWERASSAPLRSTLFIVGGVGLIFLFGWASVGQSSRVRRVVRLVTETLIFLIFFGAFVRHPWPVRALVLPLVAALLLRLSAWKSLANSEPLRSD